MAAPHNDNIKEKILNSATTLLEEKSFNEVSLAEVGKNAGVTKGSVYYYYKTKDDLLYDIADGYLQKMYEDLISWLENKEKDTSLPRLLRYVLQRGAEDPGKNIRLHLTVDAISGNEHIRGKLIGRYQTFHEILEKKIAQRTHDIDSEYYGWLILSVVDGLMIQNLLGNSNFNKDKFIEKFVERTIKE